MLSLHGYLVRSAIWLDLLALRFKAIALRDACACHNLGAILATGNYGESPDVRDEQSAFRWYSRGATRGDLESQYDLAWMLLLGEGTAPDWGSALTWFTTAARSGHCESIRFLADAYSSGRNGVPVNYSLATYWSDELAKHLEQHPEDRRKYEREQSSAS